LQAGGQPHTTFLSRCLHPRDERACMPQIGNAIPPLISPLHSVKGDHLRLC
jgi:hypothetical protein